MPYRVLAGSLVVAQEVVGVGQGEIEARFLEEFMLHPAVQPGCVPFGVAHGDAAEVNQTGGEVHRVGGGVVGVCEVYFQPEGVGVHVAFEVNVFEVAP